jgi:8-oxo-dGTP pyrophosphatase MutT (NUDIX family)
VVVEGGRILAVALEDPTSLETRLYPPGGLVEPGEAPEACAARETREETGYRAVVDPRSRLTLDYDFVWDGRLLPCRTHFFRGRLEEPEAAPCAVSDAAYHRGVAWVSLREAAAVFGYHEAIAEAVAKLTGSFG